MAIQSLRALRGIKLKNAPEGTTLYNASWRQEYMEQIQLCPEKKSSDEDLICEILSLEGVVSLIITKKINNAINVVAQKRDDVSWDSIIESVSLLLKQRSGDAAWLLAESS